MIVYVGHRSGIRSSLPRPNDPFVDVGAAQCSPLRLAFLLIGGNLAITGHSNRPVQKPRVLCHPLADTAGVLERFMGDIEGKNLFFCTLNFNLFNGAVIHGSYSLVHRAHYKYFRRGASSSALLPSDFYQPASCE
jgi:hypothetical protein